MSQSGASSLEKVRDYQCEFKIASESTLTIENSTRRLTRTIFLCLVLIKSWKNQQESPITVSWMDSPNTCKSILHLKINTRLPSLAYSAPLRTHMSIFSNLLQYYMEVFMDDSTVYACMENLSQVLTRGIDTNLVLNFEKYHFMVTEGIVLGHLVSSRGIEFDKSKIDIITSLPNPAFVWEVRSFLGHTGFYRRFIKNFRKIALPLSKLLQKDVDLNFDQSCIEAFQELKTQLTSTPILQAPN
ncbi:Retrovirus-related Pol polyprotein, partial [Mucuna pruriens]